MNCYICGQAPSSGNEVCLRTYFGGYEELICDECWAACRDERGAWRMDTVQARRLAAIRKLMEQREQRFPTTAAELEQLGLPAASDVYKLPRPPSQGDTQRAIRELRSVRRAIQQFIADEEYKIEIAAPRHRVLHVGTLGGLKAAHLVVTQHLQTLGHEQETT